MGLEVKLSIELERIFFEDLSKHLSHIMFRTRRVVEIFGIRSANRFNILVLWYYLWLLPRKIEKIQYTLLSEKNIDNAGPCR